MKKTIGTLFLAFFVTVVITGCSTGSIGDAKTAEYTHLDKKLPLKKMHSLIMEAAIEDGWRVTEFKENKLIAEKTESDETVAVTVTFTKDSFYISPNNSDLQEMLEDKLEN
jgi:anthranilate/para-aminobenzoate synthase component II